MIISMIAAVDEQYGLGKNNELLCHLPADLHHFKSVTMGKPIIMGRKTYESIGKPLPGRMNLVLSHQPLNLNGVLVVPSLESALELTKDQQDVMIIGGASVYEQAIKKAQHIYLTVIHHQFDADVYFPLLDNTEWRVSERTKKSRDIKNSYDMTFYKYTRK